MTVDEVLTNLPRPNIARLPAPPYTGNGGDNRIALAVESMARHTTDEGWQIMAGLREAKYQLVGHGLPMGLVDASAGTTNVPLLLQWLKPSVVFMQDKREWDLNGPRDFRDPMARFTSVEALAARPDVFKLTILKDAQQRPDYHRQSAEEIGCHGWVTYYHPRIVCHLAPYVRPEHLIRTYHTIDSEIVPRRSEHRQDAALLSGALGLAYPLRTMLARNIGKLPTVFHQRHPGYHRNGCCTPEFLRTLTRFKVAICTASMYGYALRKLIEATAAGCAVITDLPSDEILPVIDGNLIRLSGDDWQPRKLVERLQQLYKDYDRDLQRAWAKSAMAYYDYRAMGLRLADQIEQLRATYANDPGIPPRQQ